MARRAPAGEAASGALEGSVANELARADDRLGEHRRAPLDRGGP